MTERQRKKSTKKKDVTSKPVGSGKGSVVKKSQVSSRPVGGGASGSTVKRQKAT